MPTVGQLVVNLLGDASQFNREIDSAKANVGSMATKIAAAAAVTATLAGAVRSISLGAQFETTQASFTVLLRDATAAKNVLQELTKFAADTPLQLPEIEKAAKQLLAYQFNASELIPTLRKLGDISAALNEPLGELVYLYGTARAQGRLFQQDINQFTGRGVGLTEELKNMFSVTGEELKKMTEAGQIRFEHLEKAINNMTSSGGQFGGTMAAAAQTIEGKWSNLQDNLTIAMRELGTEIIKAFNLKGVVESMIQATDFLRSSMKNYAIEIMHTVAAVSAFAAGVIIVNNALIAYNAIMRIAAVGTAIFNAIANPKALLVGLAAAGAAVVALGYAYDSANASAFKAAQSAKDVATQTAGAATQARQTAVAHSQLSNELQKQLDTIEKINKIQPSKRTEQENSQRSDAFANISAISETIAQTTPKESKKNIELEETLRLYKQLLQAEYEGAKLSGLNLIETKLSDLTGATKELERINLEIRKLDVGENAVKLFDLENIGAPQHIVNEIARKMRELEEKNSLKTAFEDAGRELERMKKELEQLNGTDGGLASVFQQKGVTDQQKAEAESLMKQSAAAKELKKDMEAAKAFTEAAKSRWDKYAEQSDKIKSLQDKGLIDSKVAEKARDAVWEQFFPKTQSNDQKKGSNIVLTAAGRGTAEAQKLIAQAMNPGGNTPFKTLETEAKKQTKEFAKAAKHLEKLANAPSAKPFKVVDRF